MFIVRTHLYILFGCNIFKMAIFHVKAWKDCPDIISGNELILLVLFKTLIMSKENLSHLENCWVGTRPAQSRLFRGESAVNNAHEMYFFWIDAEKLQIFSLQHKLILNCSSKKKFESTSLFSQSSNFAQASIPFHTKHVRSNGSLGLKVLS